MRPADPSTLRQAFARFPSGVAALTATVDGLPTGLVASSFTVGVSQDPPLVLFAVQNSSTTWPTLRRSGRIGVSILADSHSVVCRQLASKTGDRFAGLELHHRDGGAVLIGGATLFMDCSIVSETPAGDHAVVLLQVHDIDYTAEVEPLIFHGSTFRQLASAS
jgi:flavin reductase (DIM6/NTAB) family NADH-FMN oxidoreductase RutF